MQPLDLDPQVGAQLRIEIAERLVEQEHVDVAHQRPADGDALPLAARQFRRLALQQRLDLQNFDARATRVSISSLAMPETRRPKLRFRSTVICGYSA